MFWTFFRHLRFVHPHASGVNYKKFRNDILAFHTLREPTAWGGHLVRHLPQLLRHRLQVGRHRPSRPPQRLVAARPPVGGGMLLTERVLVRLLGESAK